jgi:hypothetical protein
MPRVIVSPGVAYAVVLVECLVGARLRALREDT